MENGVCVCPEWTFSRCKVWEDAISLWSLGGMSDSRGPACGQMPVWTYLQMLLNGHISEWHHKVLTWSMSTQNDHYVFLKHFTGNPALQTIPFFFFCIWTNLSCSKKVFSVQIFVDPTVKGLLDSPFKQLSSLSRSSTNICTTLKAWPLHSVARLAP